MNASLLSIGSRPSSLAYTRFRHFGLCQILPPHLLSVSPHTKSLSLSDQDGFLLFSCFWIFVVSFLPAWHNLPILNCLAQSYMSFRHWLSFSRNASDSPVWVKCFSYDNLMAWIPCIHHRITPYYTIIISVFTDVTQVAVRTEGIFSSRSLLSFARKSPQWIYESMMTVMWLSLPRVLPNYCTQSSCVPC